MITKFSVYLSVCVFLCVFFGGVDLGIWINTFISEVEFIYFFINFLRILGILWVNCSHFSYFFGVWDDLVRPWSSIWLIVKSCILNSAHGLIRGYTYSFVWVRLRLAKNNYYPWCRALTQRKINSKPFFEYSIYHNRT